MRGKDINSIAICLVLLSVGVVRGVEIEFRIDLVPRYYTPLDEDIYLSGSFNGWSTTNPAYKLTRLSFDKFAITIDLPQGNYEYKFNRGSWSSVETDVWGNSIPNRWLSISSLNKQIIPISIANWDDMKGYHSATGNVYLLTSNLPYPQFQRTKRIWVYLPPDYFSTSKNYSVLYMHDGQNLFDLYYNPGGEWRVDEALEQFYYQGYETSIVVGVETKGVGLSGERLDELTPLKNNTYGGGKGDLYLDFLINNVKPYIDSKFRTKRDKLNTAIAGSSLGGLFSCYSGLKQQNVFGKVGCFSPSFWYNENEIFLFASNQLPQYADYRLFMVGGGAEGRNMIPNIVRMNTILKSEGYTNVKYTVDPNGIHAESFWSAEFPDAYKWLFYEP